MVTVPDESPLVDVPTKPILLAPACCGSRITCPAASTLFGWQGGTFGQVNVTPPDVTRPPGVTPALASASAERLHGVDDCRPAEAGFGRPGHRSRHVVGRHSTPVLAGPP